MLHLLLEKFANEQGDKPFVTGGNVTLSYAELNHLANLLASGFIESGIHLGDTVAHCLSNKIVQVAMVFALLKIGATELPISPIHSAGYVLSLINTAKPAFLFHDHALDETMARAKQLKEGSTVVKALQDSTPTDPPMTSLKFNGVDFTALQPTETKNVRADVSKATTIDFGATVKRTKVAYLTVSSGTTSAPTISAIPTSSYEYWHSVLINKFPTGFASVLNTVSNDYDVYRWNLQLALLAGGEFIIPEMDEILDVTSLYRTLLNNKIYATTPIASISNHFTLKQLTKLKEAGLTTLFVTGEQSSIDFINRCFEADISIINCYGPSQTGYGASIEEVTLENLSCDNRPPIGHSDSPHLEYFVEYEGEIIPLSHLFAMRGDIQAEDGNITLPIYIYSDHGATEYVGKPERTKDDFIPINDGSERILYRPGDTVTINFKTENLYFATRECVKIGGKKIFLGELVNTLVNSDLNIKAAKVVCHKNAKTGAPFLQAYVTLEKPDKGINYADVKQLVGRYYTIAAIPDLIVLGKFPRQISNGKIDLRTLRKRFDIVKIPRQVGIHPALDSRQTTVLEVLHNILINGRQREMALSIDDDFSDLGGDSPDTISLLLMLNERFETKLRSHDLTKIVKEQGLVLSSRNIAAYVLWHLHADTILDISRSRLNRGNPSKETLLFILPDISGMGSMSYEKLSQTIAKENPDIPIYTFNTDTITERFEINDLETLAYIIKQAIVRTPGDGPYQLAGWSFGSTLAWKVAELLEKEGHKVELLFQIDPAMPSQFLSDEQFARELHRFSEIFWEGNSDQLKIASDIYEASSTLDIIYGDDRTKSEQITYLFAQLNEHASATIKPMLFSMQHHFNLSLHGHIGNLNESHPHMMQCTESIRRRQEDPLHIKSAYEKVLAKGVTDLIAIEGSHISILQTETALKTLCRYLTEVRENLAEAHRQDETPLEVMRELKETTSQVEELRAQLEAMKKQQKKTETMLWEAIVEQKRLEIVVANSAPRESSIDKYVSSTSKTLTHLHTMTEKHEETSEERSLGSPPTLLNDSREKGYGITSTTRVSPFKESPKSPPPKEVKSERTAALSKSSRKRGLFHDQTPRVSFKQNPDASKQNFPRSQSLPEIADRKLSDIIDDESANKLPEKPGSPEKLGSRESIHREVHSDVAMTWQSRDLLR